MRSSKVQTNTSGDTADPKMSVRAWVATANIDAQGRRCGSPENSALTLVVVSIHAKFDVRVEERIELMCDVARDARVPRSPASLWVYPAGYFGFDAATFAWPGVDSVKLQAALPKIIEAHPVGAWVAFGVDLDVKQQQAWLIRDTSAGSGAGLVQHTVERDRTSLAGRCFDLDNRGLKAAFFVCSEISQYKGQLSGCRLIADLAHMRVPGTVWCHHAGARMLHQRELTAASTHGAAVLAHHHTGQVTKNGVKDFRHQSNWLLFQGDGTDWLDRTEVAAIP